MKNYPNLSQSKRSLSIKILSFLWTLFLFSSCSKGGGSGGGNDSQNASANVVNENPASNMQNYLLIGAIGRSDTGSVFKCSLDGTDCVEFLGGKIGLPSSPELKLQNDDSFGSSISANGVLRSIKGYECLEIKSILLQGDCSENIAIN